MVDVKNLFPFDLSRIFSGTWFACAMAHKVGPVPSWYLSSPSPSLPSWVALMHFNCRAGQAGSAGTTCWDPTLEQTLRTHMTQGPYHVGTLLLRSNSPLGTDWAVCFTWRFVKGGVTKVRRSAQSSQCQIVPRYPRIIHECSSNGWSDVKCKSSVIKGHVVMWGESAEKTLSVLLSCRLAVLEHLEQGSNTKQSSNSTDRQQPMSDLGILPWGPLRCLSGIGDDRFSSDSFVSWSAINKVRDGARALCRRDLQLDPGRMHSFHRTSQKLRIAAVTSVEQCRRWLSW